MGELSGAWDAAVRTLGGTPTPTDLDARYAQPHRRYHTAAHVLAVLRDSAWLAGELGLDAVDAARVALAACAHDVVYDAAPGDDERASASWARAALTDLDSAHVAEVERLVLCTIDHAPAGADDLPAVALLDADLAVLAADDYAGYVAGVRAEYAAVPDEGWRTGRAAVLRGLLQRPQLYLSEPARSRWESAARQNMQRELADLA